MPDRATIARETSDALRAAAPNLNRFPAIVGFDGFIDSIVHMVDKRTDMSPGGYVPLKTISAFAQRCAAAAGKSTNIEQVLVEDRFGGNGPLMAGALASLGMPTTFIGCVASAEGTALHPIFKPFADRCRRVVPIGPPSHTLCLEFDDGKLMFNNTSAVQAATWERVQGAVGEREFTGLVEDCSLLAIVNWSLIGAVPEIWKNLRTKVFPTLTAARKRGIYIDLSDPAKRTDADVAQCIADLRALNAAVPVTLGLNLSESERIGAVTGVGIYSRGKTGADVRDAAERLREKTALSCIVIHPREGAAAATLGESAWFDGPFTPTPKLSTGAGDHFNAGFGFARTLGLTLPQSLACGTAVSGAYVRDAQSPALPRLCDFLAQLP